MVSDKRVFLKIKLKSLMAESKIIRKQEAKTRDNELRESLYLHRIKDVREEARLTHLAYGLIRGKEKDKVERFPSYPSIPMFTADQIKRIEAMVRKYGNLSAHNVGDWLHGRNSRQ